MRSPNEGDSRKAADQMERLIEGCVDVVRPEELRERLERSITTGRPLVVKVGFDPSTADIHLGHVVLMRKMRQFQDCGHELVFVVGDFTAMIGDPTGRTRTRPELSRDQIAANAETYRRQAAKVLDDSRTRFRCNSSWLEELGSVGLIRLAAKYNVARMLERRDFRQRFEAGQSIAIHEFLYPLAQAYDSVALRADIELGGTDQLFNLNVGRDIMPEFGLPPQVVMTTPLLEGVDGVEKMSKSLGNAIAIEDPPKDMFGKVMSISDELMWKYWRLLGRLGGATIEIVRAALAVKAADPNLTGPSLVAAISAALEAGGESGGPQGAGEDSSGAPGLRRGTDLRERARRELAERGVEGVLALTGARALHPKEIKAALARRLVTDFHGADEAASAEAEFAQVFVHGEAPSEVEEVVRPLDPDGVWLPRLLAELRMARSNGEAIRLIRQGGVTVDGERIVSKDHRLPAGEPRSYLLKVGKRRHLRVVFR